MVKHPFSDDLETDNVGTLFENARCGRGHGSRKNAADVRMMTSRGSEEYYLLGLIVEDGANDCDIWEMTALSMSYGRR